MTGLLDKLVRKRVSRPQPVGRGRFIFPRRQAGIVVDHDVALSYVAVWACVRIIAETLASLPWQVVKREANGTRTRLPNHPLNQLLNVKANSDPTTAFDFLETIISHVLLWGNGYAEIDRTPSGNLINLWGLPPDQVTPRRDVNGRLVYEVRQQGGASVILPADRMLHFRGLSWDGVQGYSVINTAARAIGLGLATEQFGADFFGNGAHASGVLEHPGKPDDETIERMRDSLRGAVGVGHWLSPLILEDGIKWARTSIPPDDAQFLETRKFQTIEIARLYRVPPHKLADLERATFSNIGEQSVEFVTDTITPWAVRFEQEIGIKLLPRQAAQGVRVKINLGGLQRGDIKTRYEAYKVGRQWGWQSIDDIRGLEDMNPIGEEKGGNVYIVPMNFQASERLLDPPKPPRSGPGNVLPGPAGKDGAPGAPGKDGKDGETGPKGERGDRSLPGRDGAPGKDGVAGLDGQQGETGKRGPVGADGNLGEPGKAGPPGETGAKGEPAPHGAAGEVGKAGERGSRGPPGVAGDAGKRGPVGDTGDRGDRGAIGGQGRPGERGDEGKAGDIGPAGPTGADAKPCGPAMRDMIADVVARLYRRERAKIADLVKAVPASQLNARYRKFYKNHQSSMVDEIVNVVTVLDSLVRGKETGQERQRTLLALVGMWCEARCEQSLKQLTNDGGNPTLQNWATRRVVEDTDSLIERFAPIMLFGVIADGIQ